MRLLVKIKKQVDSTAFLVVMRVILVNGVILYIYTVTRSMGERLLLGFLALVVGSGAIRWLLEQKEEN